MLGSSNVVVLCTHMYERNVRYSTFVHSVINEYDIFVAIIRVSYSAEDWGVSEVRDCDI